MSEVLRKDDGSKLFHIGQYKFGIVFAPIEKMRIFLG